MDNMGEELGDRCGQLDDGRLFHRLEGNLCHFPCILHGCRAISLCGAKRSWMGSGGGVAGGAVDLGIQDP